MVAGSQLLMMPGRTPPRSILVWVSRSAASASQFCRATRSIEMYYSDRINGPNGDSATRVGSGVRFPSIDRLTSGRDRSLAEKELEVRLRM
jgi:hypothetical protein